MAGILQLRQGAVRQQGELPHASTSVMDLAEMPELLHDPQMLLILALMVFLPFSFRLLRCGECATWCSEADAALRAEKGARCAQFCGLSLVLDISRKRLNDWVLLGDLREAVSV